MRNLQRNLQPTDINFSGLKKKAHPSTFFETKLSELIVNDKY